MAKRSAGVPDGHPAAGRAAPTHTVKPEPRRNDVRTGPYPHFAHVTSDDRNSARDEARRWVRRKRIFYRIVGIYLSLSLMWFTIDMLDGPDSLWFYWPMLGSGLGVLVIGIVMGGLGGLFGAGWEGARSRGTLNAGAAGRSAVTWQRRI
jgi:hypothetical protein